MRDFVDRWSWPARRMLADRLVGEHAYSRNVVGPVTCTYQTSSGGWPMGPAPDGTFVFDFINGQAYRTPFNQDAS